MRRLIAAALAVALTVGAADALQVVGKALIFGGVNSGSNFNGSSSGSSSSSSGSVTPPPPPPVSTCASNLLLDYSDACNLMAQMTGN